MNTIIFYPRIKYDSVSTTLHHYTITGGACMEIVRNFINILGLADVNELPGNIGGQTIQYSESETIFIPKNRPDIKSIFQILIEVEIKSTRIIKTPNNNTVIIDGIKKLKIIYTQSDSSGKAIFMDLELPFNTFAELPKHVELDKINIYILDAYFTLIDERKIYSHFVFVVNIYVGSLESHNYVNIKPIKPKKLKIDCVDEVSHSSNNVENLHIEDQLVKEVSEITIGDEEVLIDLDAEYL